MLHTLRPAPGSVSKRKRVARGNSAGGGTTAGRGTKGQDARAGKGKRVKGFEGGQVPLIRRQPKLGGFKRDRKINYEIITLHMLELKLEPGTYTVLDLRRRKIARSNRPVKILSSGSLTKKFDLSVHAASKSAKDSLVKAGGSLHIIREER